MKIKNIIFDWSGTLCDDFLISHRSTITTLKHFGGKPISRSEYRSEFNLPARNFYKRYLPCVSYPEINRFYFDYFSKCTGQAPLFKGAKTFLKLAWKHKLRLFVFSTVRQSILDELCRQRNIISFFDALKGNVHDKTKELGIFCRRYDLKKNETLYVGDTEHDIEAARQTGVWSSAFLRGYHTPERLLKKKPDFVWNDYQGLRKFFENCTGESRTARTSYPVATVGALIFNKGDIFLIQTHKWGHTFGIPGGKIKYGETMMNALKREIREETGLTIKNVQWAMVQDSIDSKEFYVREKHFLLLNFYAESSSRTFRLNQEAESGIWVNPKIALTLRLNEPTRWLLNKCNR